MAVPQDTGAADRSETALNHVSKFTRRRFVMRSSSVIGGLALAGLMSACGGDDETATTAATPTSSTGSTATNTPEASSASTHTPEASSASTHTPDASRTNTPTPAPTAAPTQTESPAAVRSGTPGGDLVIGFAADPESLDPHRTSAQFAQRIVSLIYDELACRDYDGAYAPGLATEWEVGDDGLIYTFTLRDGVTFHSGKPMTSADVKYTFERWKTLEGSPNAYTIDPIETIDTPDDLTVVLNLSTPFNVLFDSLTSGFAVVLNQDIVESAGDSYGVDTMDGTGPFEFVSWTRSQQVKLARFDAYAWGPEMFDNAGPAYLDTVEFRIIPEGVTRIAEFQAGNIHVIPDVPLAQFESLSNEEGVQILQYPQWHTTYFGMNVTRPPVDDVAVRRAISHGIDRQAHADGAFFGIADLAPTFLHPDCPYFWKESLQLAPAYDPDLANQILDEAGWARGNDGLREKDGAQLVIPLWHINGQISILQAQILQEQFSPLGIRIEPQQYEESAWFAAVRTGEQTTWIVGMFHTTADAFYQFFHTRNQPAPNRFLYSNPEMDEWLVDARTNPDPTIVAERYRSAQAQLLEDVPSVGIIHQRGTTGVLDAVQGIRVQPTRWFYRFLDIWLED